MTLAILLWLALDRTYHPVPVAKLAVTKWTHAETCGVVTLVKREADGDVHIRLEDGRAFVVLEIVPYHPLAAPKKGQRICARGVTRIDKTHGWAELHPLESWRKH